MLCVPLKVRARRRRAFLCLNWVSIACGECLSLREDLSVVEVVSIMYILSLCFSSAAAAPGASVILSPVTAMDFEVLTAAGCVGDEGS